VHCGKLEIKINWMIRRHTSYENIYQDDNMYTVHLFNDGTMVTAAKHALVKGMEDDEFNQMLPTTSNIDLSSLISNNSNINLSTTTAVPQPLVPATITGPPPPQQFFQGFEQ
jgi:hypothetical protein